MSLKDKLERATNKIKRKAHFALQCGIHVKKVGSPKESDSEHIEGILKLIKSKNAHILELGPGLGAITYPLLENNERTVTAVEILPSFYQKLADSHPRLVVIKDDASNIDSLVEKGAIRTPIDYVINGIPFSEIKDIDRFLSFIRQITREAYIHYSIRNRKKLLCQYFPSVTEEKINGRRIYLAETNATYRTGAGN